MVGPGRGGCEIWTTGEPMLNIGGHLEDEKFGYGIDAIEVIEI